MSIQLTLSIWLHAASSQHPGTPGLEKIGLQCVLGDERLSKTNTPFQRKGR